VAFGSFLPMDRGAVVTEVSALFTAKLISRITAIRLLMAAGFEIEDARNEVKAIEADDVEGAKTVADATGSEQAAADRLGITLPEKPKPPEITLPPPPNQPPEPPTPGGP
jgi:outer membrane biosynthesis protein TonB